MTTPLPLPEPVAFMDKYQMGGVRLTDAAYKLPQGTPLYTIPQEMDAWGRDDLMAIAAVRYCLGRMTYITADCADWLLEQWPNICESARSVIQRDVEEAFARDDRDRAEGNIYKALGWDCDRRAWERVRLLWAPNVRAEPPP